MLLHHARQHDLSVLLKNSDLSIESGGPFVCCVLNLGIQFLGSAHWALAGGRHEVGGMGIGLFYTVCLSYAALSEIRTLSYSVDVLFS